MKIKLDQHFMKDENILNLIVNSSKIKKDDIIFEIGAGYGTLTKKILNEKPSLLISIEKDENLKIELEKIKKINDNKLKLIFGDGLKEFDKYNFNKLIANIPYSITEVLYQKILEKKIPFIIMLHGIDFYKNLKERETKWRYFVNSIYDIELIEEISGDKFTPFTKVKSVIIKLELKKKLTKEDIFYQNLFERKNRNTKNAIIYSYVESFNLNKNSAKIKLEKINLDKNILNKKLNNLSNKEFIYFIEKLF